MTPGALFSICMYVVLMLDHFYLLRVNKGHIFHKICLYTFYSMLFTIINTNVLLNTMHEGENFVSYYP